MIHSDFAGAFVDGARFLDDTAQEGRGEIITMTQQVIGTLQVPTGRLFVGDPLTTDFDDPGPALALRVPTGAFSVEIAIAHRSNDRRIACARIRFLDEVVATSWRAIRFEDPDVDGAPDVDVPDNPHDVDEVDDGYDVDGGMGCFFDAAACAGVDESTSKAWLAACDARQQPTFTHHVADVGAATIAMFSSGDGDGWYTTYAGYADDGRLVEVVTDFELLIADVYDRVTLPMPLRGHRTEAFFVKHNLGARTPWWSKHRLVFDEFCQVSVTFDDGTTASSTAGVFTPWQVSWPAKTTKTAKTATIAVYTGPQAMRRL